ncbi:TPA: hypothetical protein ACH3X2_007219 [Trebouxia sp. C0005]
MTECKVADAMQGRPTQSPVMPTAIAAETFEKCFPRPKAGLTLGSSSCSGTYLACNLHFNILCCMLHHSIGIKENQVSHVCSCANCTQPFSPELQATAAMHGAMAPLHMIYTAISYRLSAGIALFSLSPTQLPPLPPHPPQLPTMLHC